MPTRLQRLVEITDRSAEPIGRTTMCMGPTPTQNPMAQAAAEADARRKLAHALVGQSGLIPFKSYVDHAERLLRAGVDEAEIPALIASTFGKAA
jgi:hypothetical protein